MGGMVFKKLLSSLGFGGVDVDTVLTGSPTPSVTSGEPLTGEVRLQAKSEVDIASIQLLLVCSDGRGELELARYPVAGQLRLASGSAQAVRFSVPTPASTPFNLLYGQQLPGYTIGVRTEVAVTGGSAKTDFDPVQVAASEVHQHVIDGLGGIGCKFVRNELRHGSVAGLPVPAVQAVTFYAPIPEGQQVGPHIPQLTFNFAGDDQGMTVIAELADRPGQGDHHRITRADAERLSADEEGWFVEIDGWVKQILTQLSQPPKAAPGSFMQPSQQMAGQPVGAGRQQQQYAYGGRDRYQGYQYGGYQRGSGMGGMIAAGVGGAALGFLGGMMIGGMMDNAFGNDQPADAGSDAGGAEDPGAGTEDASADYAAQDYGGGDYGGGDWGGGDFGGGEF